MLGAVHILEPKNGSGMPPAAKGAVNINRAIS